MICTITGFSKGVRPLFNRRCVSVLGIMSDGDWYLYLLVDFRLIFVIYVPIIALFC